MPAPSAKPRRSLLDRPGGALLIVAFIFGTGYMIGALIAKLHPRTLDNAAAATRPSSNPSTDATPLAIGDRIDLHMADGKAPGSEKITTMTIDPQGLIKVPLIGSLKAAGMTPGQVEEAIAGAYRNSNILPSMEVKVTRSK
jgi:protein involved in polysaccharide export with SLBB domain